MEEIVLKKIAICDIIPANRWHPGGAFFMEISSIKMYFRHIGYISYE